MSSTAVRPDARPAGGSEVSIRSATPADAEAAARIAYEAFARIADRHRFPRDFPTLESARELAGAFIAHPAIWGVVAEREGRIVGSNFLDERAPVRGVGPITVAPEAQGLGVGRRLMEAVIERGAGAAGIRLLQDSFNAGSLALYASLGFRVEDYAALMGGRPRMAPPDHVQVRPLEAGDLPECERLHRAVHGDERTRELRDALDAPGLTPVVARRDGRVVAYATTLADFGAACAVAESERDMSGLVAGTLAAGPAPASFLLPTSHHELFRWCLDSGLRVVKTMTYMAMGDRRRPNGAWIPSVLS